MAWVSLCEVGELVEDQGKYVEIDGFQLAVFLHEGGVFAMDNECPHAGGSLAGGVVDDGCAVCPWHDWSFSLRDGTLRGSDRFGVKTYKTRVLKRDGKADLAQADLPLP